MRKGISFTYSEQVKNIADKVREDALRLLEDILPDGDYHLILLAKKNTGCNHFSRCASDSISISIVANCHTVYEFELTITNSKFEYDDIVNIINSSINLANNQKQPQ